MAYGWLLIKDLFFSLFLEFYNRGVAQLGLAHLNGVQEVAGSNPVAPTITNKRVRLNLKEF